MALISQAQRGTSVHRHSRRVKWKQVPPVRHVPRSDKLVITVATGEEFTALFAISRPLMETYARRIGADFVAVTDVTQEWAFFEKFRIADYARLYERVIYLDADCLVKPGCRSLFDVVPGGTVGAHDDLPLLDDSYRAPLFAEYHQMIACTLGIRMPDPDRMLNAGVMVFDGVASHIWTPPPGAIPGHHCDEQFWVDDNISRAGIGVTLLPPEFNFEAWFPFFNSDRRAEAQVVHLAGVKKNRLALAKAVAAEWGVT